MWERRFQSEVDDRISHNCCEKPFSRYVCLMALPLPLSLELFFLREDQSLGWIDIYKKQKILKPILT